MGGVGAGLRITWRDIDEWLYYIGSRSAHADLVLKLRVAIRVKAHLGHKE